MSLPATFLGLVATLHSAVDPAAVAKFAAVLEHTEQRLADLEISTTGKVAAFVEHLAAPAPAESTPAAVAGVAADATALLAQLAQLLAAHQAPAPVVTPDAAG